MQHEKLRLCRDIMKEAVAAGAGAAEKSHHTRPSRVKVGDLVFLKINPQIPVGEIERQRKLLMKYEPRMVLERHPNNTVTLMDIYTGKMDPVPVHLS